ncbi:unnamed protein product [Phytophthora lilii]|uniref:Unnamed protein product n=1 Tax=Phytophthora lilii TaxID=2077276 RepID=A0A9W6TBS9_9STRA|nr:unnamed protein product [Phytophthora lilii]
MIIDGSKSPSIKNAAERVEAELFKGWITPPSSVLGLSVQTPQDVFALLKLDKVGDEVLQSSMFKFWTKYLVQILGPELKHRALKQDRKTPSYVAALLKVQDKTDANWQLWKNYQIKLNALK